MVHFSDIQYRVDNLSKITQKRRRYFLTSPLEVTAELKSYGYQSIGLLQRRSST